MSVGIGCDDRKIVVRSGRVNEPSSLGESSVSPRGAHRSSHTASGRGVPFFDASPVCPAVLATSQKSQVARSGPEEVQEEGGRSWVHSKPPRATCFPPGRFGGFRSETRNRTGVAIGGIHPEGRGREELWARRRCLLETNNPNSAEKRHEKHPFCPSIRSEKLLRPSRSPPVRERVDGKGLGGNHAKVPQRPIAFKDH